MLFSHPKGLYTIMVNEPRRVVYEAPIGEWKASDYIEYQKLYVKKIRPLLGEGKWALCTDLRKYKLSEIDQLMGEQIDWYVANDVKYTALIVDSAMIKMRIDRVISNRLVITGFLDEAEADEWLKSLGF